MSRFLPIGRSIHTQTHTYRERDHHTYLNYDEALRTLHTENIQYQYMQRVQVLTKNENKLYTGMHAADENVLTEAKYIHNATEE